MIRWTNLAVVLAASALWGCNPAGGADERTLSSASTEVAGENCPYGGQKIMSGIDANGNGILEANEVLQVAYVCNGDPGGDPGEPCTTLEGGVTISNEAEWDGLVQAGCTRITGTLAITAVGVTSFSAQSPLVQVGALDVASNGGLTSLSFPALTTVDEAVTVYDNAFLTELAMPSLATVGAGGLLIQFNPALGTLSMPRLATASRLFIGYHPALTEIEFTALASVEVLEVTENDALTHLSLPALAAINTPESWGESYVSNNASLASVSLPVLDSLVSLTLGDYSAPLTSLDLSALTTVTHSLAVTTPRLSSLDLPRLTTAGSQGEDDRGGLFIIGASLSSLTLPSLATVSGSLSVGVAVLPSLSLPELTSVGRALGLGSTARRDDPDSPEDETGAPSILASVHMPKLASVGLDLGISRHPALTNLTVPVLASVGGIGISETGLTSLSFEVLNGLDGTVWYGPGTTPGGIPVSYTAHYPSRSLVFTANPLLTAIDVPLIAEVPGSLSVWGDALPSVNLPLVTRVGSNLTIGGSATLASVSLPALTTVGGTVSIGEAVALTSVGLPALTTVGGAFKLTNAASLTSMSVPLLESVRGEVSVLGLQALPCLDLPSLTTVGNFLQVKDSHGITSINLPALSNLSILSFINDDALTSLSLPSLTDVNHYLYVIGNAALSSLSMPALTHVVFRFYVYDNPVLPQCQASAIYAHLAGPLPIEAPSITNNDMTATCP